MSLASVPGALAVLGLIVMVWLGNRGQMDGAPSAASPDVLPPAERPDSPAAPDGARPTPGRYLLLSTDDVGLAGVLDNELVFHGEEIYFLGPTWSGAAFLDRHRVSRIIWPDGVDPTNYPMKK